MERFDKYLSAVWVRYGLIGVVVIIALLAALAWFFQIDVKSYLP